MFCPIINFVRAAGVAHFVCTLALTCSYASFSVVTEEAGIDYIHSMAGDAGLNHSGSAAVDVDGDGWSDLLVARFGKRPLLYMNAGDGSFVERGEARGLGEAVDASAFGAGDFDNDGDQDLFIVPHDKDRFWLYINDGSGNFTEDAVARGAALVTSLHNHKGYSVGLVDYDLDGFLDVYVSEWGVPGSDENELHSPLLRNLGASGSPGFFELVTAAAELTQPSGGATFQYGFSSAWGDFDRDGWPDLALVADFGRSRMYWNDGDGTFTESARVSGVGKDEHGMGVAVADYDGDGMLDFYVTSIYDEVSFDRDGTQTGNKLYRNLGDRLFVESSFEAGVHRTGWGWGTSFFEYDNDGDPDLVATNGSNISEGGNPDTTPFAKAANDPTELFSNDGSGRFLRATGASGITDTDLGKAIVVFDYDNDGDEDLFIANTLTKPILYKSNASDGSNKWIRFKFVGVASNRDGYGSIVTVADGGKSQTSLYNPSNAYIGQREGVLHFGLGGSAGATLDSVLVVWPSGIRQELVGLATNQIHVLQEPPGSTTLPSIVRQPTGGSYPRGDKVVLSVEATGDPAPVFIWEKNGETIDGASGSELVLRRFVPFDLGSYRVKVSNANGFVVSDEVELGLEFDIEAYSVARWWNEFLLEAIRKDFPAPTIHGRNLYHVSAAMWDAFWAYDLEGWNRAGPVYHREVLDEADWGGDRESAQAEAISYAAYRVLLERYRNSVGRESSYFGFRWLMEALGYDPDLDVTEGNTPAAVGNRIGYALLAATLEDGSNEANGYVDTSGYEARNEPLVVGLSGTAMQEPNFWQPLAFDFRVTQNGIPIGEDVQSFVGVNWRAVDTFAIEKTSPTTIAFDPGAPPRLGSETDSEFKNAVLEVIRYSSLLDPRRGEMIDVSPKGLLNNRLGTNDGTGRSVNPITNIPYEENRVNVADYGRILAEFWADGPSSETPPGHWNALLNEIGEHPDFRRKYAGIGPELSRLEWDVQSYLALNGGMHDAAVASWTLKRQYDYSRPISMIRHMGGLGQSSDPDGASYHEQGLPLESGLVEVIAEASSAPGERHEHLAEFAGEIAIFAWSGEPDNQETEIGGVDWIRAVDWLPYQRDTFVTPAFAAYVSGHSTFSRTAAEVVTLLTGTPFFPGGLGEFHFEKEEYLEFENGPSSDVNLQWATYYDAADQAGISRLYGGIHVRADDFVGRRLGARIGLEAFLKANSLRSENLEQGGLSKIRLAGPLAPNERASLVEFELIGSASALPVGISSDVAVDLESGTRGVFASYQSGEISIGINGEFVRRLDARGLLFEGGEQLQIDFEVTGEAPAMVLLRSSGVVDSGSNDSMEDTAMKVFRILPEGGLDTVAENDDWGDYSMASLVEMGTVKVDGEDAEIGSSDSGVFLELSNGAYRVTASSATDAQGVARLILVVLD